MEEKDTPPPSTWDEIESELATLPSHDERLQRLQELWTQYLSDDTLRTAIKGEISRTRFDRLTQLQAEAEALEAIPMKLIRLKDVRRQWYAFNRSHRLGNDDRSGVYWKECQKIDDDIQFWQEAFTLLAQEEASEQTSNGKIAVANIPDTKRIFMAMVDSGLCLRYSPNVGQENR